jgi:hypothetical protein
MGSNNVLYSILKQMILILMTMKNSFPIVQIWDSQHNTIDIQWNNIKLYLINEICSDSKPKFTPSRYL